VTIGGVLSVCEVGVDVACGEGEAESRRDGAIKARWRWARGVHIYCEERKEAFLCQRCRPWNE
jgi:hypothetical protein